MKYPVNGQEGHPMIPRQPFQILQSETLTPLQQQALVQLYQPITGPLAINLYWTLSYYPIQADGKSQRMMHIRLLDIMNIGLADLEAARLKLEGIGLLKTYRQEDEKIAPNHRTLYYELQLPASGKEFFRQPLLANTLYHQIGDQAFEQLWEFYLIDTKEKAEWEEVSQSFDQVYGQAARGQTLQRPENLPAGTMRSQVAKPLEVSASQFDYGRFLDYVLAGGIDHSQVTEYFKEQILSLHLTYGLTESMLAELVRRTTHPISREVNFDQLRYLSQQYQEDQLGFDADKDLVTAEILQEKIQSLKQAHQDLSAEEVEMVALAQVLKSEIFLMKTKESKNGFATSGEKRFVRQLRQKTQLEEACLNVLIYYILVILNRDNITLNELERLANQWQQQKVLDPVTAMKWIRRANQEKASAPTYPSQRGQRQDIKPSWMDQKYPGSPAAASDQPAKTSDSSSQEAVNLAEEVARNQAALRRLMTKEVDR